MRSFVIWILAAESLYSVFALYTDCTWTYFDNEVVVNCSGRGLTSIPRFNDSVTYLDLSHNRFSSIPVKSLPNNLKHLDISWNNIKQIKGRTFEFLSKLKFLDLSYCNLQDVDRAVFGELINLQHLNLSYNRELGFASLPNITFHLNKTKMLSLIIDGINCATGIGTYIRKHHLDGIRTTHLRKLSLANNRLELFERGVIYNLPKTLMFFSIAGNKVTAGEYLIEMHTMSNVRVIDMSYQYHPQVNYPYSVLENCEEKVEKERKTRFKGFNTQAVLSGPNWSMPLPPNLETLYLQSGRYIIKNPSFSLIAPNLRHVYLQNNFIMSNSGRIIFPNNTIITCDISNNIFSHNPVNDGRHMKYLNISNNRFDKSFMTDTDGTIFATYTSLEVIDMSFNNIFSLPTMLLKNSHKLRYINASNNRLSNWMVDLTEMPNLISLDLSENKFTTLSEGDRNHFEKAFQNSNLSINLFRNGITCTCENQEFLIWIQKHKKHFLNFENYTCSTKRTYFDFKNLRSSLAILKKQCASYLGWYIACAVTLATFLTFLISVLLVRNKWKIRYLIYKFRQRFGFVAPFKKHLPTTMHYQYDAFISYCGRELMFVLKEVLPRIEVDKNLRLLIRDRDYIPGIPKVDTIMSSLQESKRTVCIVSKKYLESKWRDYELNMAKVEGIKDRGSLDYVILILLPEVYNDEIPHKIIDLIRKDRYIEYPMESCAYDDFWDRLIKMIEE
ncbi:toll-like receptor 4 [Crassostrea angulata]|uniref:toll-like receptor 4 n=1 Tax=Magallana angulata TaxID=2784310 RepID=UPI0022B0C813|nr:toll-like receptor 4 [Crassostrea angulata]